VGVLIFKGYSFVLLNKTLLSPAVTNK